MAMDLYNRANLDLLHGRESAGCMSAKIVKDEIIDSGEWVYQTATGVKKVTGAYDPTKGKAYVVFGGNVNRLDGKYGDAVTVCFNSAYIGDTNKVAAVTINPGDPLTVTDGVLTKAADYTTAIAEALSDNTSGRVVFVPIK
jgi:hypothetical protein